MRLLLAKDCASCEAAVAVLAAAAAVSAAVAVLDAAVAVLDATVAVLMLMWQSLLPLSLLLSQCWILISMSHRLLLLPPQ